MWPSKRLFSEASSGLKPVSTTIQQISSLSNGLFPLLLGSAYLYTFSDGFGEETCYLFCLKKGQWWEKLLAVTDRNVAINEYVSRVSVGGTGTGYTLKSILLDVS